MTSPSSGATVTVHNKTILKCSAEAVPEPSYTWLQEIPGTGEVRKRSYSSELVIDDVWYADQGQYRCVASNNIGNMVREQQSEPISIDVTGAPQITSEVSQVTGTMSQQVEIVAEFCSDPGPIRNTWNWDNIVLPSGNSYGESKYQAEMKTLADRPDCYQSTLVISNLASDDMRNYQLNVENIHGTDTMDIKLIIQGMPHT